MKKIITILLICLITINCFSQKIFIDQTKEQIKKFWSTKVSSNYFSDGVCEDDSSLNYFSIEMNGCNLFKSIFINNKCISHSISINTDDVSVMIARLKENGYTYNEELIGYSDINKIYIWTFTSITSMGSFGWRNETILECQKIKSYINKINIQNKKIQEDNIKKIEFEKNKKIIEDYRKNIEIREKQKIKQDSLNNELRITTNFQKSINKNKLENRETLDTIQVFKQKEQQTKDTVSVKKISKEDRISEMKSQYLKRHPLYKNKNDRTFQKIVKSMSKIKNLTN